MSESGRVIKYISRYSIYTNGVWNTKKEIVPRNVPRRRRLRKDELLSSINARRVRQRIDTGHCIGWTAADAEQASVESA